MIAIICDRCRKMMGEKPYYYLKSYPTPTSDGDYIHLCNSCKSDFDFFLNEKKRFSMQEMFYKEGDF